MVKQLALKCIRFYQLAISPIFGPRCRFIPTCSQYTYEAIKTHGLLKGTFLGIKRILRCHPFNHSCMYDPVPLKKDKKY